MGSHVSQAERNVTGVYVENTTYISALPMYVWLRSVFLEHFICRAPGMGQKEITTSWKIILLYGYILNTINILLC